MVRPKMVIYQDRYGKVTDIRSTDPLAVDVIFVDGDFMCESSIVPPIEALYPVRFAVEHNV